MAFTQNAKQVVENWGFKTFDAVLSYLGGYLTVVWFFISLLAGGYQSFRFDNHLMKSLYT